MRTTITISAVFWLALSIGVAAADRDLRLVEAARRHDAAAVSALVKQRADVNAAQADGATALHWAAYWDDLGSAALLIGAGAKVNAINELGVTALSLGCTNGSEQMVLALLAARADPNLAQPTGETPLMTCARSGSVPAVNALIGHGATVEAKEEGRGQTALMWAVAAGHPRVVKALLEARADVNARSVVTSQFAFTGYRFTTAPPANPSEVVVDAKDGGSTPLLFAAQQGDLESARLLLDSGARVSDAEAGGRSALLIASHSGHGNVATLLLERGADPNAMGAGYTALHAAVLRGDLPLVKALLARGAHVNARLTTGTPVRKYSRDYALNSAWLGATPYWLAARYADASIMRALAESGADTRLSITDGTTPLMATLMTPQATGDRRERFMTEDEIAAKEPGAEAREAAVTAALAVTLGADVNAITRDGDTALHTAVGRGLNEAIELLVRGGADLTVKNKRGLTPLGVGVAAANRRGPDGVGVAAGTAAALAPGSPIPTVDLLRKLGATE